MTLHEQNLELCALFKTAGVKKPEHESISWKDVGTFFVARLYNEWADQQDCRDLLAAHFERLWCGLEAWHCSHFMDGKHNVGLISGRAVNDEWYGHEDKITAILLAMGAKYAVTAGSGKE